MPNSVRMADSASRRETWSHLGQRPEMVESPVVGSRMGWTSRGRLAGGWVWEHRVYAWIWVWGSGLSVVEEEGAMGIVRVRDARKHKEMDGGELHCRTSQRGLGRVAVELYGDIEGQKNAAAQS